MVNVEQVGTASFTGQLATPPMAVPVSSRYNNPGNHNWFMLKIEDGAQELHQPRKEPWTRAPTNRSVPG